MMFVKEKQQYNKKWDREWHRVWDRRSVATNLIYQHYHYIRSNSTTVTPYMYVCTRDACMYVCLHAYEAKEKVERRK